MTDMSYTETPASCSRCHASIHHGVITADGRWWCLHHRPARTTPAEPVERESAMTDLQDALKAVPVELLLDAINTVHGVIGQADLPEVEVTDEGLGCPWDGCDGVGVEEVDSCTRVNRAEYVVAEHGSRLLSVTQEELINLGGWETVLWRCARCKRPVEIPAEQIEVTWS